MPAFAGLHPEIDIIQAFDMFLLDGEIGLRNMMVQMLNF